MTQGLSLTETVAALDATLIAPAGTQLRIVSVSTDTRTLKSGDLFVALIGPNHDAHDHCQLAMEKGADALLVSRELDLDIPQLLVADTLLALGALSRLWAAQYQVPLVAITGSNGKTTVKEMVRSILAELGPVHATQGNLNNEIGVPLTLLGLRAAHQYAVVEMGANHRGEIGYLSKLASPAVALVNNIGSAHLEGFGSLDAVASAKSEIFLGVDSHAHAVINADDRYADTLSAAAQHCQRLRFGFSDTADVRGRIVNGVFSIKLRSEEIKPQLQLLGKHNRRNALAAAAIADCLDIQPESIQAGLEKVQAVAGRLQRKQAADGTTVIDDSYNANPVSTHAAIEVLAEQQGEQVLVLGDMLELGDAAATLHAEVGDFAREIGIDKLFTVGTLASHAAHAFGESAASFANKAELLNALRSIGNAATVILVKGSRGAAMEEVVQGLLATEGKGADREVSTS